MKAVRIVLFISLIACAGGVYRMHSSLSVMTLDVAPVALVEQAVVSLPLEEIVPPTVSVSHPLDVREVAEPVEVKTPVQPLEERGQALLFEIDALAGMPFDQAILMPFD